MSAKTGKANDPASVVALLDPGSTNSDQLVRLGLAKLAR